MSAHQGCQQWIVRLPCMPHRALAYIGGRLLPGAGPPPCVHVRFQRQPGSRDLATPTAAKPPRAQPGLTMRPDRRRRLQYKIPLAVFGTLWERALQRSWSSSCPLERTESLFLGAHNRCRVSQTQPRSTTQMEYRRPNERNDEHESPQNDRRSELYSY